MFLGHEQNITERYFFSHKVQMVQAKVNSHLNILVYSLISFSNIKDENKINNQQLPCAALLT